MRDCRWRLKKSALCVHLTLEIERVGDRVRTDAVVVEYILQRVLTPQRRMWNGNGLRGMDGCSLLTSEGDVVVIIVWRSGVRSCVFVVSFIERVFGSSGWRHC